MKIEMYSVKDSMVGFSQPFCMVNEAVALRAFIASVRSPEPNVANTFPENKSLWKVGTMDDQTGELTADVKFIAEASPYVIQTPTPIEVATKSQEETKND